MIKKVEVEYQGLKCDNPECGYRDDSIPYKDYVVGSRCPECDWVWLTQEDMDQVAKMIKIIQRFNWLRWLNPMNYWRGIFGDNRTMMRLQIETGTGIISKKEI